MVNGKIGVSGGCSVQRRNSPQISLAIVVPAPLRLIDSQRILLEHFAEHFWYEKGLSRCRRVQYCTFGIIKLKFCIILLLSMIFESWLECHNLLHGVRTAHTRTQHIETNWRSWIRLSVCQNATWPVCTSCVSSRISHIHINPLIVPLEMRLRFILCAFGSTRKVAFEA